MTTECAKTRLGSPPSCYCASASRSCAPWTTDRTTNFIPLLVHLVDDDVRPFEKFAGSIDQAGTAHVDQLRNFEPHHLGFDARDYFRLQHGGCLWRSTQICGRAHRSQRD